MTKPDDYPPTPELDNMKVAKEELGLPYVGYFLEWLREKDRTVCEYDKHTARYEPVQGSIESLLAEYAEIDLEKAEDEKRAVLEYVRKQNDAPR